LTRGNPLAFLWELLQVPQGLQEIAKETGKENEGILYQIKKRMSILKFRTQDSFHFVSEGFRSTLERLVKNCDKATTNKICGRVPLT